MHTPSSTTRSFLVFRVGEQACALAVDHVREIVPMATLSRPPGSPAILAGVLDLGGEPVPVVRLDRLYGLAEEALWAYTPLIVLRGTRSPLALLVGAIEGVVRSTPEDDLDLLEPTAAGALRLDERLVAILAPERLLHARETERLEHLRQAEVRRLADLERTGGLAE